MPTITKAGLEQLDRYKYQSGGWTPLDGVMNHWWITAVKAVPMWMAPNMVTLIGLMFLISGFSLVLIYSPDLDYPLPSWVILYNCFCHFMYQTLDAIDGKHARRTGASSPLGQLFDHGCDSLGTMCIVLPAVAAARLGSGNGAIICLLANQLPFFTTQWEEYHTHKLRTNMNAFIGVTEAQLTVMFLLAVSGIFGQDLWTLSLGFCELRQLLVIALLCTNSSMVLSNYFEAMSKTKNKNTARMQLVPILAYAICAILWAQTKTYQNNTWLTVTTIGGVFSHLTSQMIVCGLTHMRYPLIQWTVILLPIVTILSYIGLGSDGNDLLLALAYFIFVWSCIAHYIYTVISEITHHLGIYCLKLGKRPKAE